MQYHELIERLVTPGEKGIFVDRQIATVFELRHYPRYFEVTERLLEGMRHAWRNQLGVERLLQEIELTLAYINGKR